MAETTDTAQVREAFAWGGHDNWIESNRQSRAAAFDTWLAKVREEAFEAGVEAAHLRLRDYVQDDGMIDQHALIKRPANPFTDRRDV